MSLLVLSALMNNNSNNDDNNNNNDDDINNEVEIKIIFSLKFETFIIEDFMTTIWQGRVVCVGVVGDKANCTRDLISFD